MIIANPIYDVVFKYLLEDVEIAMELLSTILGEEIQSLELKPQETATEKSGGGISILRFDFKGNINAATSNAAKWEISSATVTLVNPPIVTRRAELQIISLDYTLENVTTGESIYIALPIAINKTLYIDTNPNAPFARYRGQDVSGAIVLNTTRAKWLKLSAENGGVNILRVTGTVGATTIVIKRRDRMLFY